MVMVKLRCEPGTEQATLSIHLTTASPTLSLSALTSLRSASGPAISLQVHVRCTQSTHPTRSITLCTQGTILDTHRPSEGHMDSLALGKLGPGLVCKKEDGSRKVISMGNFRVHRARQNGDNATNLLERPATEFVTVPSAESGEELVLTHEISAERLFAYAERIAPGDLEVGEKYEMKTSENYLGTIWWCWGDLEDDLKGKKLHSFSEGFCIASNEEKPSDEEVEKEGWVTGEDVSKLVFRFGDGGNGCSVEIVH